MVKVHTGLCKVAPSCKDQLEDGSSTGVLILCTKAGNGHSDTNVIALCLGFKVIEFDAETISHLIHKINKHWYFVNH